jgi:hypothetical protein
MRGQQRPSSGCGKDGISSGGVISPINHARDGLETTPGEDLDSAGVGKPSDNSSYSSTAVNPYGWIGNVCTSSANGGAEVGVTIVNAERVPEDPSSSGACELYKQLMAAAEMLESQQTLQ